MNKNNKFFDSEELNKYFNIKYNRKVKCISEYIFNKHENFDGIRFIKGELYEADLSDLDKYKLIAVRNNNTSCGVGMSDLTFFKHFELI